MFLLFTAVLVFTSSISLVDGQCGRPCKSLTDCPSNLVCNQDGMCDDDSTGLVTSPPVCPIPSCKQESFVYRGPTIDQDHCFTNTTYQTYSCSPPVNRDRNLGILYYFDLVNEGVAKCDKKHYAGTELVAAMSTGWFSKGEHCFENVTITAGNGRSVIVKVVDECVSTSGCTPELFNYGPCSPKALSGTAAVWDALGYNISVSIIEITWNFTHPTHLHKDHAGGKKLKAVLTGSTVAGGIGIFVILVTALVVGLLIRRKSKSRTQVAEGFEDSRRLVPERFKYKTLHEATGGFDEAFKLGEGGYGSVYKGRLPNGTFVAVKRIGRSSKQGLKQFKAEVMSVGGIHHVNLVKLIGYSTRARDTDLLLVYEYVSNGSLDTWIFSQERFLTWRQRISIALDVARGLAYLHEGCREKILHLDIKPHNIMLDENMVAKISDFGFAKLLQEGKTHTITGVRGTKGYMAPEWLSGKITEKTDVYSYGVLLLELVHCRKFESMSISTLNNGNEFKSSDSDVCQADQVRQLGLQCIREDSNSRPIMNTVIKVLEDMEFQDQYSDLNLQLIKQKDIRTEGNSHVQITVSELSPR